MKNSIFVSWILALLILVALFAGVFVGSRLAKSNRSLEDIELVYSQATQTFELYAHMVQENFNEAGATFTLNSLEFVELANEGARVIFEFAYAVPDALPTSSVPGELSRWIAPLTSYCGTLNPRRGFNWRTKVTPDLATLDSDSLREGMIRIEKTIVLNEPN